MLDTVFAILHHLLIFALLAGLAMEFALTRDGMRVSAMRRLFRVDIAYGVASILVIIVGVCRVIWGIKGADYYLHNLFFWLKMTAFLSVGLCSIKPTLTFLAWRRASNLDEAYLPKPEDVRAVRRWLGRELALFPLIPVFAALMARYPAYIGF